MLAGLVAGWRGACVLGEGGAGSAMARAGRVHSPSARFGFQSDETRNEKRRAAPHHHPWCGPYSCEDGAVARGQERRWQQHQAGEWSHGGGGGAPCALQAAAELWVEAPRRNCSVVLAILDEQHGGAGPRSARLGAARRAGWNIGRRSATHHRDARRCAPAPTSGGRPSREAIGISTEKHLRGHPSTCQNEVGKRVNE